MGMASSDTVQPSPAAVAFVICLGYALGAASLAMLRAGLDARRRELRRDRQRRASCGTAFPARAPAQADKHAGAPGQTSPPGRDINAALRPRCTRAASQIELLSSLKDLEAKFWLSRQSWEKAQACSAVGFTELCTD